MMPLLEVLCKTKQAKYQIINGSTQSWPGTVGVESKSVLDEPLHA